MSIRTYRMCLIMILFICIIWGGFYFYEIYQHEFAESTIAMEDVKEDYLIAGGMPIGIYLECEGVLITGTEKIKNEKGDYIEPAKNLVKPGDYIVEIEENPIDQKEKIIELLRNSTKNNVKMKIRRKQEYIVIDVPIIKSEEGEKKLGIWIKDDAQGLGTITFLNANCEFGALGHGIIEPSTNEIIEISEGTLYKTSIQNIVKGSVGSPGGMEGVIIYNKYNVVGKVTENTSSGIYGRIEKIEELLTELKAYPVASKEEIEEGDAVIRCFIDGKIREYDILIKRVNEKASESNKGIEIQVTDQELISRTGGIVQGMSGSPIIQNGKLIGAVTHVFVQDSTRGYGIFIENMLANVEK